MAEIAVNILCRAPMPGKAKTRLAAGLGQAEADRIYRLLLSRMFTRLESCTTGTVHVTPWESRDLLLPLVRGRWRFSAQTGSTLGDRIIAALQESAHRGFTQALVIGSDCPDVSPEDFGRAGKFLRDGYPAVFGPSHDGGYWLAAVSFLPGWQRLFEDIPWSTPDVLEFSISRCREVYGEKPALLDVKRDLDTPEDWDMLKGTF